MQICIPPILVEVLSPHFAVRYSCRYFSVRLYYFAILVEVLASYFAVTIWSSFNV